MVIKPSRNSTNDSKKNSSRKSGRDDTNENSIKVVGGNTNFGSPIKIVIASPPEFEDNGFEKQNDDEKESKDS
jgi:hypothetical protein